jgi:hypothetical protein
MARKEIQEMKCFKKKQVTQNRDIDDRMREPGHASDYKVWVPFAENIAETEGLRMRTRGEYVNGYPSGLVVHWTSGWHLKRGLWGNAFPQPTLRTPELEASSRDYALRTAKLGVKNGHNYLVMDAFGRLYQSRDLTKWGYHAGKSFWSGTGYSVSNHFAGVEILSPGELTKTRDGRFVTWFDYEVPSDHVREVNGKYFHQFSIEQENQLVRLCLFLVRNSPRVGQDLVFQIKNIVGHDEVSPGRKSDPGGSLSFGMDGLRDRVLREIKR